MDDERQLRRNSFAVPGLTAVADTHRRRIDTFALAGRGITISLCVMLSVFLSASLAEAQSSASLRLIQSDATRVVLELESPTYIARDQVVTGTTYALYSVPGLESAAEAGKPQLPIRGTFVALPQAAQPTLRIVVDDSRRDAVARPPLPGPTQRVQMNPLSGLPASESTSFVVDAKTYGANQSYPAQPARIAQIGTWRSQRFALVEFRPLQYNPVTRQLTFHKRLRVEISFGLAGGARADSLGAPVDEGPFESLMKGTFLNYGSASGWRSSRLPPRAAPSQRGAQYVGEPWYKITLSSDGLYKITCDQLSAAGVDVAGLDPSTIQLFKQGSELAINVLGANWSTCDASDYLVFFGKGIVNKYSSTNTYWLTFGKQTGKRMAVRDGSGVSPASTFTSTVHLEQDRYYETNLPAGEDTDHWMWDYITPVYGVSSRTYHVTAANYVSIGVSPTLEVSLVGYSTGGHHTKISLNGNLIMDSTWTGAVQNRVTIPFSQTYLQPGDNTIVVTEQSDLDPNDFVFTDYVDLRYPSAFAASSDSLRFQQPVGGAWTYEISGFGSAAIETFDVTDPSNVSVIGNTSIAEPCPCVLEFSDTIANLHDYVVVSSGGFKSPIGITRDVLSDLHNPGNGADEIIVSHNSLLSSVQTLANFRASQGLRVKVVDVQDIYDEFNDGVMDPRAIRDFLAFAYASWQSPAPSFVLLVGNGSYDPKGNCLTPGACPGLTTPPDSTLIPAYLRWVDPWIGETASDNRLVSFDDASGNTLPFMAIGRLPVTSAAQLTSLVGKIVNYEQNPAGGDWRTKFLFVADNPDSGGDFWALSDGVANDPRYVPSPNTSDRIYFGQSPFTDSTYTRNSIIAAINGGRLVVNYVGHGAVTEWAGEHLFRAGDASGLSNGGKLPVILSMTCWDGYFIHPNPDLRSLDVAAVLAPNGGALASWSPSGWGLAEGHDFLNKGFLESVWSGPPIVGTATINGKLNLWLNGGGNRDLIDTFNLLGDPASRLNVQSLNRIYLPFIRR